MDTEVLRDLRDFNAKFAVYGNVHDVISELLRVSGCHRDHPSKPAETSHVECHQLVQQPQAMQSWTQLNPQQSRQTS